ncbi:hypothetical protein GOBAR_AA26263 [Gossypium barbadense]|uniref:Uncharacterized protein n=1 Tax=Gossypium barbadense TaxID=3634 RepID=A0A2P5WTI1_GOSBA|nr:hypothetical protein GOBAR_AA26263 [Gossypium barbadense]
MSNKSPIFPMPEPHHFSDYGFDPQFHYFQVLEQARKHKKGTRDSIDSLQFKLEKPISKDDPKSKTKKYWWRNALLFFNWKKWSPNSNNQHDNRAKAKALRASNSGPIYMIETSNNGSTTPYRTSSRPSSGPLTGISTPYISLRELNMEQQQHRVSTSSLPIYLVT